MNKRRSSLNQFRRLALLAALACAFGGALAAAPAGIGGGVPASAEAARAILASVLKTEPVSRWLYAANPTPLQLVNLTGLDDSELHDTFVSVASETMLAALAGGAYAPVFWVEVVPEKTATYCYAAAWVAPTEALLRPRIPQQRYDHLIRVPAGGARDEQHDECRRAALAPVLQALLGAPWAVTRLNAEETHQGRPRPALPTAPVAPGAAFTIFSGHGVRGGGDHALRAVLEDQRFTQRFDARSTQVIAFQAQFRSETDAICLAIAGVGATAFTGHAPRLPGVVRAAVVTRPLAGQDVQTQRQALGACVHDAMEEAGNRLLGGSGDDRALLADLPLAPTSDAAPTELTTRRR